MNFFNQKINFLIFLFCTYLTGCTQSNKDTKIVGYTDSTLERRGFSVSCEGNSLLLNIDYDKNEGPISFYEFINGEWKLNQAIDYPDTSYRTTDFGKHMAVQGDCAFVATYLPSSELFVYKRNSGKWSLHQRIKPIGEGPFEWTNPELAVSGNTLVVGDSDYDTTDAESRNIHSVGKAFIFQSDDKGEWKQTQVIYSPDPLYPSEFGWEVSINEKYMAIGAWAYVHSLNGSNRELGSVYLFEKDKKNKWILKQRIQSDDKRPDQQFGTDVFLWKDQMIVGARGFGGETSTGKNYSEIGAAYIFERGNDGVWKQKNRLTASDKSPGDRLGWQVAMNDDYAVVSTINNDIGSLRNPGAVYVFEKSGSKWKEKKKIIPSKLIDDDMFGYNLFLEGNRLVVGTKENSSAAYIYYLE